VVVVIILYIGVMYNLNIRREEAGQIYSSVGEAVLSDCLPRRSKSEISHLSSAET
jgi:hypothetical protein